MPDVSSPPFGDDKIQLPSYHASLTAPPAAERFSHRYELKDRHEHAWITLCVLSATPSGPEQMPRMVEGEPITGSIELDLKEEKDIKSITVSVSVFLSLLCRRSSKCATERLCFLTPAFV